MRILWSLGALLFLHPQDVRELKVGEELRGVIDEKTPVVESAALTRRFGEGKIRRVSFSLRVEQGGEYEIEVVAGSFPSWLVLREGTRVAAEAEGAAGKAKLVGDLASDKAYTVEVCALRDGTGEFRLRCARVSEASRLEGRITVLRQELAAREREHGSEHEETMDALNNLGLALREAGQYAEAERRLRRAHAICEKISGSDHANTAAVLSNLASLLKDQGRFAEAEALHRQALAIGEKLLGSEHLYTARMLNNLAVGLIAQGKLAEAEPLLHRVLAIRERALGSDDPETAASLNNLAMLLKDQGKLAEAEPLLRRALAIQERALASEDPETATSLDNLALLLNDLGRLAEAEPLYRRSLAIREIALGSEHPATTKGQRHLASLLKDQGKLAEAELLFRRALAIEEKALGSEHPDTARTLHSLVHHFGDLGLREPTLDYALRFAGALQGHAADELALAPTEDRFLLSARVEDAMDHLLSATALGGDAADAFFTQLMVWKGLVFRAALRTRERLVRDLTPSQQELVGRIQGLKNQLSHLAYAQGVTNREALARRLGELQAEKRQVEGELLRGLGLDRERSRVTARDLAGLLPEAAAFLDLSVLSTYRFARLVEGKVTEPGRWQAPHIHAWVVRAGDPTVRHIDLGPAPDLVRVTSAFLAELEAVRGESLPPSQEGPSPNDRLRALLWEPLARELGAASTVFVCADRFLARIPFETIQLAEGRFLVEDRQFVYAEDPVTLAGLLRSPPPTRTERPSLFCVGGVDYESRGKADALAAAALPDAVRGGFGRTWDPLSQTRPEVEGIAVQLRKHIGADACSLVLTDDQALEERIKAEAGRYSILHLATHGYFEPTGVPSLWEEARKAVKESDGRAQMLSRDEPRTALQGYPPGLLSGLVLAGANGKPEVGREDGYLTAEEVDALPLKACDLVVLSACETGLGTTRGGEGMMSVRRAFREAGAKTVISSLWRVRDESTRKLMAELYRRMWQEGQSPAQALRGAQLWLLADNRRRDAASPRPSTWGAFVVSGEWR